MGRQDLIEVTLRRIDFSMDEACETFLLGQSGSALDKYERILKLLESLDQGLPAALVERLNRHKLVALTTMGDILLGLGRVAEAEKTFESTFARLEDSELLALPAVSPTHLRIAEIHRIRGDIKNALEQAKKALSLAEEHNNPLALALSSSMIGGIIHDMGRPREALKYYEKAYAGLKKPRIMREFLEKVKLFFKLGRLFLDTGDKHKSGVFFQEGFNLALGEAKSFFTKYSSLEVLHFINAGKGFFELVAESDENQGRKADLLLTAGDILNIKSRWDFALDNYSTAAELVGPESNGGFQCIRCANGIGNVLSAKKDYKAAQEHLGRAHEAALAGRSNEWAAETAVNLGTALSKSGSDSEGVAFYNKALELADGVESDRFKKELTVKARNQLGFIRMKARDYAQARDIFEEGIELLKESPMSANRGESFQFLGQIRSKTNDFNGAEKDLFNALDVFQKQEIILQVAMTYKLLGLNAANKAEYEDARYFFDEAIEILQRLDIIQELPILITQKGKLALAEERYKEAEKIFKEELAASEKTGNKHMLAFSNFHLGQLYRIERKEYLADRYLHAGLDMYREVGNRTYEAMTHLELALFYRDKTFVKKALEHADEAESILKKTKQQSHMAYMAHIRGLIYGGIKGKQNDAEYWFERSIDGYQALGILSPELAQAYFDYGNYWHQRGNRDKAMEFFREAINASEMLGVRVKTKKYLDRVAEIDSNEAVRIKMQGFMSREVAQKVDKDETGMVTIKRQDISVLFADIRGFTSLTESVELSELQNLLNDFYQTASKAVLRNRGMVNKFIGDNVMALFNINGDNDEHPYWAVRAGMEILDELRKINRRRKKVEQVPILVGVGVNSGQVLLGSFGSVIRQDFTAVGDNVNVAARLQAQSKGDELIISTAVFEALGGRFEAEDLGEVTVKGKKKPIPIYKVIKEK